MSDIKVDIYLLKNEKRKEIKIMITIFAKKRTTKDGKKFDTYNKRLNKKDGSTVVTSVKFPDDNKPNPLECPMNIEVPKDKMNLSTRTITDEETGAVIESRTLWIKEWNKSKTPYVDTSLDDFDI